MHRSSAVLAGRQCPWCACRRVPHQVLNARPGLVAREAAIIAQAGLPGRVTIATNVAGRGTDIILGGNPKGLTTSALEDLALPFLALRAPAQPPQKGGLVGLPCGHE